MPKQRPRHWVFMDDSEPEGMTRGEIIGALIGILMILGGLLIILVK